MGKNPNHAYIPKRGVHTAFSELLTKIQAEPNAYEFDLENFFGNVDLSAIERILKEEYGMPARVAGYLTSLNRSITKLGKVDLLDESNDRKVLLTPSRQVNPNLEGEVRKQVETLISTNATDEDLKEILPDGS